MSDGDGWSEPGPDGSTPLDPDESEGLLPSWVATRDDLNEAEQANIARAVSLPRWRGMTTDQVLDDMVARALHKDMFDDVWSWAGTYRRTERNIGIDPTKISICVRDLMEDAKEWTQGARPMDHDEAACLFHHRLVQIHPFPNGNGRHARVMTNILLNTLGERPFTWGQSTLMVPSDTRNAYIRALRAADAANYDLLAGFVRS